MLHRAKHNNISISRNTIQHEKFDHLGKYISKIAIQDTRHAELVSRNICVLSSGRNRKCARNGNSPGQSKRGWHGWVKKGRKIFWPHVGGERMARLRIPIFLLTKALGSIQSNPIRSRSSWRRWPTFFRARLINHRVRKTVLSERKSSRYLSPQRPVTKNYTPRENELGIESC